MQEGLLTLRPSTWPMRPLKFYGLGEFLRRINLKCPPFFIVVIRAADARRSGRLSVAMRHQPPETFLPAHRTIFNQREPMPHPRRKRIGNPTDLLLVVSDPLLDADFRSAAFARTQAHQLPNLAMNRLDLPFLRTL